MPEGESGECAAGGIHFDYRTISGAFLDNSAGGLLGRVLLCLVSAQNEPKRSRFLVWILVVLREKQNGNPNRRRG
jgi:hypothetical protein